MIVTIEFPATAGEIEDVAGSRCPNYEQGCACCDMWKHWDETGNLRWVDTKEELLEYMTQPTGINY